MAGRGTTGTGHSPCPQEPGSVDTQALRDAATIRAALENYCQSGHARADALAALARLEAREHEQAEAGDDRWSAVVECAALATPAPWCLSESEYIGVVRRWMEDGVIRYGRDVIETVGPENDPQVRRDAEFIVTLVDWFFSRAGAAGGSTSTRPEQKPNAANTVKVLGSTLYLDSPTQTHGVKVQARQDEGWLRIVVEADESVIGWALAFNGRDIPISTSTRHEGGAGGAVAEDSERSGGSE